MNKAYTLNDYMKMPHKIEIMPDPTEGGFVASYPELPGCITCADSIAELETMLIDCKKEWLKAAIKDNLDIYVPNEENFSGQIRLRIPSSLHKRLAGHAKEEKTSLNQYCIYLLSSADEAQHHSTSYGEIRVQDIRVSEKK